MPPRDRSIPEDLAAAEDRLIEGLTALPQMDAVRIGLLVAGHIVRTVAYGIAAEAEAGDVARLIIVAAEIEKLGTDFDRRVRRLT